jgi:hypothetical protein
MPEGGTIITRPIPSPGEKLPAVGPGSWITFNVGYDEAARASWLMSYGTSLMAAAG